MKKIIIMLLTLACVMNAAAQDIGNIAVSEIRLSLERDGMVDVSFNLEVGRKLFNNRYSMMVTPAICNGSDSAELPRIMVQGRRARISGQRRPLAANLAADEGKPIVTGLGETTEYSASVPFQAWMSGADLVFDAVIFGCNAMTEPGQAVVASNIMAPDTVKTYYVFEIPGKITVGDELAERFSFIVPIEEFERAHADIVESGGLEDNLLPHAGRAVGTEKRQYVETFVERNKPGSLIIFFTVADSEIKPGHKGNGVSLDRLTESVRLVENSGDSRVELVVITGFASPEGALSYNENLAWDRAGSVKDHILRNTPLKEDKIRVFNGSEDWLGLRMLVERSDMENKGEVLEIIDAVPVEGAADRRLERIRRLDGGRTYRHIYENFFPELRNAAYIKVYYENNE